MSEFRVASRYAKSLLDLAQEKNLVPQIYSDIVSFNETLANNQELKGFLRSPIINGDKKFSVLKKVFANHLNALTIAFFEIIIRKRREQYLPIVADAFIKQYRALKGISLASVKTAVSVSSDITNEVKSFIEKESGKKIDLDIQVDPNLIGGFIIQIEDRLYDASVAGKLKKAKKELLSTYISK